MQERTLKLVPPYETPAGGTTTVKTLEEAIAVLRGNTEATGQIDAVLAAAYEVADSDIAPGTRNNYRYWWERFERFCTDPNARRHLSGVDVRFQLMPADPAVVQAFYTDLITAPPDDHPDAADWYPMTSGTLNNIASAVRHFHVKAGHDAPTSHDLTRFLKGAKRTLRRARRQAEPLLLNALAHIGNHLIATPPSVNQLAHRLVITLYNDTVGLSDIANLTIGDLTITNDTLTVATSHGPVTYRRTNTIADPVAAAADYLAAYPNPHPDAALIINHDTAAPATRQTIRWILNSAATRAGTIWITTNPLTDTDRARLADITITNATAIRDRALLTVGYAAALRRDELVRIAEANLTWHGPDHNPDAVTIAIPWSKTNQTGSYHERVTIHTTHNPATCGVTALKRLINLRHTAGLTDPKLPIFTSIHRSGRIVDTALSGQSVADIIRRNLTASGATTSQQATNYSGHSLRRGYCTDAAHNGHDALQIARQTRHRNLDTVQIYVADADRLDPTRNPQARLMRKAG